MRAVTYQGRKHVDVKNVPDPKLVKADDLVIQVTSAAICGSDLHLIHGMIPNLQKGYILGHEAMGVVVAAGPDVERVRVGQRVIVPFNIACGTCIYCQNQLEGLCDNSNEHNETGAIYGYSDTFGGYDGGQAELLRVPYGNFGSFVVPESCERDDEELLFLSDILPTAYWGVRNAGVKKGDTVVVLGCGPVGLLAQRFSWMEGAARVIAVDRLDYRLAHAKRTNHVETIHFERQQHTGDMIKEMTRGGADVVIDCVGLDGKMNPIEVVESALKLQVGTLSAIVIASQCVRKGGVIQLIGVYGARYNAFPLGDLFARGVTLKMGQASVIHLLPELFRMIENETLRATDLITHRLPLSEAPHAYRVFDQKEEDCIKVVLKP
ncbi:zinc-dependent alcohol dehydrogenase [Ferroacidibacillus organovorans]|uniref:Glutathione-dependent formaldehyde dehydrogenase n=1 Tax=Ferroacidibacillus organovorans TaxID=1765683 RepID=A0A1V4ET39_9BACL|nr:zinc-dependent alcohol dehydrogenase [Ferroacidibacillus organovorans]OPG16106.1 glutathione-dependent formaldehyde dehydrogenase [Ferroacidibacillus organovorans]